MKVYEIMVDRETVYNGKEWRSSLGLYRDLHDAVEEAKRLIKDEAEDVVPAVGYTLGDVHTDVYGLDAFEQSWTATTVVRTTCCGVDGDETFDEEVWKYFIRERELI